MIERGEEVPTGGFEGADGKDDFVIAPRDSLLYRLAKVARPKRPQGLTAI